MLKKSLLSAAGTAVFLLSGVGLQAQPYSNAVMTLNPPPVGYWPLNETTQPPAAPSMVASNSGTLGAIGTGYYGSWYQASGTGWVITNSIAFTNGYTGDSSKALWCQSTATAAVPGQYVVVPRNTNGVSNPAVTIVPPFSVEVWALFASTNGANRNLVSEGQVPVNCGGPDPSNPYYGGLFNGWAGFALGQFQDYIYFSCFCTNGTSKSSELDTATFNQFKGFRTNTLIHIVATFTGTTETIYTNGVQAVTKNVSANGVGLRYVPDLTTPLMIGQGNDVSSSGVPGASGALDDVAIYTNVLDLAHVQAHYAAATNGSGTYAATVLGDSPLLYYRFDDTVATGASTYASGSYPVANNYGSVGASANGIYQPGTTPGVAGPAYTGFGGNSKAVAFNGFFGTVNVPMSGNPQLNPTNITPLSVVAWFKSAPADAPGRFEEILGHSDSSYRLALGQVCGENHFNPGPAAAEVQFTQAADVATNGFALNDGKWHMVAGVSDGTNDYMYLDGRLAKTNTIAAGINIAGTLNDLVIGGDPQYTFASGSSANTIRDFDGSVAQVAFFTNALSGTQIQSLYTAAGVPPTIAQQPPSPLTANAGTNLSITMLARGSAPLSYQWFKVGSGAVGGQTTASLTFNPLALANAGTYNVVVTNSAGSITSSNVVLSVNGPPVVTAQTPTTVHVFTGTHPVLRALVTGPQPISYQWTLSGSPIPGANASSYQPSTGSIGTSVYNCSITNAYGPTSLNNISVQVLTAPTAPYPVRVLADSPAYYFRLDEADDGLSDGNPGATAWDYAGGLNAVYTNTALNQLGYSTGLANQDGYSPATEPSETAAAFDQTTTFDSYAGNGSSFLTFAAPTGSNAQFSVEAWYQSAFSPSTDGGLVAIGYGFGGEQFALDCGAKISGSRTLRFYVNDASGANHGISATNILLGDNLWHHVVAVCDEAGGKLSLYVDGVLNSSGAISSGIGLKTLNTPLSIGARLPGVGQTSYTNQFVGSIDDVSLYNYALSPSTVLSHYVAAGVPPTIVQAPPVNVVTNEGSTVVLNATVIGSPTLNYQWQLFGGNIGSATTSTLTLPNVSQGMSGNNYVLTVNNTYGSASTAGAGGTTLTVNAGPPIILTDISPLNATNYVGNSMTYSVLVGGSAPFTYQWFQDGSPVPNATNASYTLTTLSGQNTYSVHVTNTHGPADSSTATLTGVPVPTLNPSDYNYKAKITFAGYNRSEVLSDFPALVVLTNIPGFSYSQLASPTGGDLRFTDATGTRELPSEIDDWNPAGVSTVWVQVPRLGTNTDSIWAYWGNPAATTPLAWSTNGGVWTPQAFEGLPPYEVVYHLKEGAYPYLDSTSLHTATNGSTTGPAATAGLVGTAGAFTGTTFLDAGTNDPGDAFTLSAWVNIPTGQNDIQTIWANQHGGFGAPGFAQFINTYQQHDQIIDLATGDGVAGAETKSAGGAFPFGGWHHLESVVNRTNGTVNYFVDGTGLGVLTGVTTDFVRTNDLRLGEFLDNNFGLHGAMDEARIQQGNSSANWIWADYMTMGQNSAFQSYGTAISSIVYITGQEIPGGKLVLSWPNGTLLEATSVLGPWTTNLNTSPYTNTITGPQHFYKVRVR